MSRLILRLLRYAAILLLIVALPVAVWLHRPLPLTVPEGQMLDVQVPPGASALAVAQTVHDAGVETPAWVLYAWFRLSGHSRGIQAGSYELPVGTTPLNLLDQLVNGTQALRRVTLVEGWNYRQMLKALREADHLRYDLPEGDNPQALLYALGLRLPHPEGRFFPDTYVYPKNARASTVLKQAAAAMDKQLAQAWAQRADKLPLNNADDALVLASLVEKETNHNPDRAQVAGVFVNRLRLGMRLQTDPAVIYGMGTRFDGNLRKRDLQADSPYNTYLRKGLPPTPIAMPSRASLLAAVRPAPTRALYFVARGDGSSHFSQTLAEHNQAVRQFQLKKR